MMIYSMHDLIPQILKMQSVPNGTKILIRKLLTLEM